MSTTTQRPTPETDNAIKAAIQNEDEDHERLAAVARKLERERDEALAKLSNVYRWIERNHPDGFIDSQSHLQNLDRVADAWHDKLQAMREAIKEAHADIQSGHELWPVWVGTPTTMQVHQSMQSALAKLQPFLKP